MRLQFALALLVLSGGCTGGRMPPPLPPPVSTSTAPRLSLDGFAEMPRLGPSDKQISAAYRDYQRRLPCPEEAICGSPAPLPIGLADCRLMDSLETQRCSFVISAIPYGKRDLYRCEALFQSTRDVWRLVRMTEECEVAVWRKVP
jgi:hypothetical protein